ncbi:MAG: hypothetical protein PHZ00_02860 [Candidatus Peribacteraceae bacterium]|nr:hypothetical protein [Candidatus Peribacteraceae bacterium]
MRRTILVIGIFELIALGIALLGMRMGLQSDEAKYLLEVPFSLPHAIRWFLSFGASLTFHEFLMRFVLASIAVQAGWLLWDLGTVLPLERQMALVGTWLLSAALIMQGGTLLPVTMTTVCGLAFVWVALHPEGTGHCRGPCVGLLWLLSLFISYQCLLYAPLVWSGLRSNRAHLRESVLYFTIPVLLLGIYLLGYPLAVAGMPQIPTQDMPLETGQRFLLAMKIFLFAGGYVTSVVGLWGILTGGRRDLFLSLILILTFILLFPRQHHAVLLLPLLTGGFFLLFCRRKVPPRGFLLLQTVATIIVIIIHPPKKSLNIARETMAALHAQGITTGMILIDGAYGHEWQYESRQPIRTFSQELRASIEEQAAVFICTKKSCEDDRNFDLWTKRISAPLEVWTK